MKGEHEAEGEKDESEQHPGSVPARSAMTLYAHLHRSQGALSRILVTAVSPFPFREWSALDTRPDTLHCPSLLAINLAQTFWKQALIQFSEVTQLEYAISSCRNPD